MYLYGTLNSLLMNVVPLNPIVLRIRITNRCNLHCDFCYLAGNLNVGEKDNLSSQEWDQLINKLPRRTLVDITGAEPFLANDFDNTAEKLLKKGLKVSLITNGMFTKYERIERLVKNNLYYLMISLDGLEDYHNNVRGNKNSFKNIEKFCGNLKLAKEKYGKKRPILCIKTTVTEDNYQSLKEIADYAFGTLGASQMSLNILFQNDARGGIKLRENISDVASNEGNTYKYPDAIVDDVIENLSAFFAYAKKRKYTINLKPDIDANKLNDYLKSPKSFGVNNCKKPYSVVSMYYNGDLTPCDINLNVGNVRELNFNLKKIWNLSRMKKFISYFKSEGNYNKACESCCLAKQSEKYAN